MLSGRVPFQSYSREASAAAIMQRIREGEFSFVGLQWDLVSSQAKSVIKGLLTVDPKKRLTMSELLSHPWVQGHLRGGYSTTPLMTPDILSSHSNNGRNTGIALKATFDAFHMARREGFRLLDVSAAPLAQRRKLKKSSDARSSCSSTSSISISTGTSSSSTSSNRRNSSLTTPTGLKRPSDTSDSVFNYSESKVSAYLSGLPSISDSTETQILNNMYLDDQPSSLPIIQSNLVNSLPDSQLVDSSSISKRQRDDSIMIIDELIVHNSNENSGNNEPSQPKRQRLDTIVIE